MADDLRKHDPLKLQAEVDAIVDVDNLDGFDAVNLFVVRRRSGATVNAGRCRGRRARSTPRTGD